MRRALALVGLMLLLTGCGTVSVAATHGASALAGDRAATGIPAGLLAAVRPIGRGPRFQPPAGNRVLGACRAPLGTRQRAHIELFGANRVLLLAAGIGTRAPRRIRDGRVAGAICFGALVTLDPTGTLYFRSGGEYTVADIFSVWGQALTTRRIASFTGGRVRAYVDGHQWRGAPGAVPLRQNAEIVLEVGPHVVPHTHFSFAPQPVTGLR